MLWQQKKDGISEMIIKYYGFLKYKIMIRKIKRNKPKEILEK